ncbi:hypothetical protein ROHU_001370 [Labeo rohita]|uniref:Uncharacterized protein n=1 Tax=Labeo rohita TaxID=84645 RepID=A0A498P1V6_LABRO|nr:hypothetical protein ROHU_001370 [Labeo rohita]
MGGYRDGTGKVEGSEVEGAGVEGFCETCRECVDEDWRWMDFDFAGEESGHVSFRACEIDDGPKFLYAVENERVIKMRLGNSRIVNLYKNACGAEEFGQKNAVTLKIGCVRIGYVRIDEKIFLVEETCFRKDRRLCQRG